MIFDPKIIYFIKNAIEGNISSCRMLAKDIMKICDLNGDYMTSQYIFNLLNKKAVFFNNQILNKVIPTYDNELLFPEKLTNEVLKLSNKINNNICRTVLFYGKEGTGKFSTTKRIAQTFEYDLYSIDMCYFKYEDEKGFKTNINNLEKEIKYLTNEKKIMLVIKNIDCYKNIENVNYKKTEQIILEFINFIINDNKNIVVIMLSNTKNISKDINKFALNSINFDVYSEQDLLNICYYYLHLYFKLAKITLKHEEIFYKMVTSIKRKLTPCDIENIIRETLCLTEEMNNQEFLKIFYMICFEKEASIVNLRKDGYTNAEIMIILNRSKSVVDRKIKKAYNK